MTTTRNRQREFEALQESAQHDVDPENDAALSPAEGEDDSDSGSDQDVNYGREHYMQVSKSRLRKPEQADIDPRYRGARVDRERALSDDSNESMLSGSSGESDTEHTELSDDDQEEEYEEEDDEENESMAEGTGRVDTGQVQAFDREELRRAMAADRSAINTSILAAAKSDAEKGRAAKRQRLTYDSFLNVRIKMQKSLVATNSLATVPAIRPQQDNDIDLMVSQAETAAFDLWSRLTAYREEISRARSGGLDPAKLSLDASKDAIVKIQQKQETEAKPHRDAVLQKWSHKSRAVTVGSQRSRINTDQPATIVDVLNEQLSNMDRLLQRARTPRSCAPIQLGRKVSHDATIYDDADFYGLLLKELLEAKSAASASAAANVDIKSFINIRREAKTKRNVDTKASKGRKLKYTVHEKLQNYCAPDDRTTWTERQRDELFSSLFGQRMGLQEDQANGGDDDSDADLEDAGLMLFRNT